MHKNGFIFLESILAIVILTSSLLLIYSSFKKILSNEKAKIKYDEINYIYRTEYLKTALFSYNEDTLNNLNIEKYKLINLNEKPFNNDYFIELVKDFEIKNIILVDINYLNDLKSCLASYDCNIKISNSFQKYIGTIKKNINAAKILIVEYNDFYYSWVSV